MRAAESTLVRAGLGEGLDGELISVIIDISADATKCGIEVGADAVDDSTVVCEFDCGGSVETAEVGFGFGFGLISDYEKMVLFDDDAEVDADAIGNLIAIEMDAAGLDSLVAGGGSEDSVFGFASEKEKLILFDNDDGSIGLDYSLKIECNSVTSDVAEYVRVVEYVRAAGFGLFVGAGHSVWRNVVFDPFETGGTWADDDLKATRKSVAYVVDVYVRMAGFVSDRERFIGLLVTLVTLGYLRVGAPSNCRRW